MAFCAQGNQRRKHEDGTIVDMAEVMKAGPMRRQGVSHVENPLEFEEPSEDVSIARRHIIDYLGRAQEQSLIQAARLGTPPLDFNRVLTDLKYAEGRNAIPNMVTLFDTLFERGVPPVILRDLSDQLDVAFPENQDLETHLSRRFFGSDVVSAAKPDSKFDREQKVFGGGKWLGDYVNQQLVAKELNLETAHRIQLLGQQAASRYGADAAAVTRLMYMCGVDEPSLKSIITARTEEAGKNKISRGDPKNKNFFEKMQGFLGVYVDITTKVVRNTEKERKDQVERQSKDVLAQFLRSKQFQVAQESPSASSLDPFRVFGGILREEKGPNPWLLSDGKNTPFNVSKFDLLFTPEVPRGLIADAAFFLNNYEEGLLIQEIHQLFTDIDNYKEKKIREKRSTNLSQHLVKKITTTAERVHALQKSKDPELEDPPPQDITDQQRSIEKFAERQSRSISAFSVLLRMVDAEKIVGKPKPGEDTAKSKEESMKARREFNSFISGMPKFDPLASLEDYAKRALIFGSSVQMYLENTNEHLDVPLLGVEGNPSIRTLLITKSEERWFDEAVLKRGPHAYSKNPDKPPERPLIQPRDLLGLSAEEMRLARMNFNTAKGASWTFERRWINNAGAAMARLPNSYKNILRFARNEADVHWNNAGDYVTAFHPSASDAMGDIVSNLFPPVTDEDYILGSHEEYDTMITPFTEKGAQFFAVHCNDREHGRAKTPHEILDESTMIIEREKLQRGGRLPLAFVFSGKTRLGDAVGVVRLEKKARTKKDKETGEIIQKEMIVGERTPNAFGIAEIFQELEKRYPGIRIIMDCSQSLGRNDRGEDLNLLKPHIMVASCGKALGVKNISVAMIRKTLEEKSDNPQEPVEVGVRRDYIHVASETPEEYWQRIWKDPLAKLTPGKGTINTPNIAAQGIALQHLNSRIDTWGIRPNPDRYRKPEIVMAMTQREMIAEHNARLTGYAIDKTSQYALELFKRLKESDFPVPIGDPATLASDPLIQKQFGCQVVYPVHRKSVDYTFVTLTFPNLGTVERKPLELKEEEPRTVPSEESVVAPSEQLKPVPNAEAAVVTSEEPKTVPVRSNYLLRSLEKNGFPQGYAGEQCMLGGNGLRVSFNNLQDEGSIDVLFNAFISVHVAFLKREVERSKEKAILAGDPSSEIKSLDDLRERTLNVLDSEWIED